MSTCRNPWGFEFTILLGLYKVAKNSTWTDQISVTIGYTVFFINLNNKLFGQAHIYIHPIFNLWSLENKTWGKDLSAGPSFKKYNPKVTKMRENRKGWKAM